MLDNQKNNRISIIIPTLNEEGNVQNLAERIRAALTPKGIGYEMIFIDDHSKDGTLNALREISRHYPASYYLKKGQGGKAYSLLEGFDYASHDLIAMIDADLQYPPEAIPEMIEKINNGSDIVVANRIKKNTSFIRTFLSKGFFFVFGKLLHGLNCDVQSGLKVFRKQIIREIKHNLKPKGWTFDLGFLIESLNAGYTVGGVSIVFDERTSGQSKINVPKVIYEIGTNAIAMKFKKKVPYQIFPVSDDTMAGGGMAYKGKRFITHTTLNHQISALKTFTAEQKITIALITAIAGAGFYFYPLTTTISILAVLSVIYFSDVLFNLFLVLKSLNNPPELKFTSQDTARIKEDKLPVYSILCPLFRESRVLPGFVQAIEKLDWPKDKLDVLLLLEENDQETIKVAEEMDMPSYVRTIIVPHSMPKTKPKACNYGLAFAQGEYLVIYDAEDIPEPQQLKKAYLGFQSVPENVKCIQAKLNYFNSDQNLLTRLFTSEYSLWFDVVLPGLQSINTSIPLGGTSNHFRTRDLINLKGWDPFNVTEDCDLGIRLFKLGYKTAILDSTTLEEANSNLKNWIRQRSRWIKGYMQTYLVHMRNPGEFFKKSPAHFMFFQFNVGGKIAFMLINPILWATTISYFAFRPIVGPTIEQFYPSTVLYLSVFSLIFGNFLYLYYYMIGCAKREQWSLIKYVFFVPFYWLFMSVASLMALYELIVKPHYWQKTHHGLHLAGASMETSIKNKEERIKPTFVVEPLFSISKKNQALSITKNPLFSRGAVLIMALIAANGFNFLFNAFLGRKLSLEDLGLVTLINTLWYLASIFVNSVSSTVNHRTAYLSAKENIHTSLQFWKITMRMALMVALGFSVIYLLFIPYLSDFFQIEDRMLLLLFTPTILFGVIVASSRGFLQGNLMFHSTAVITIAESFTKLFIAVLLVYIGWHGWVFTSIPGAIIFTALIAFILSSNLSKKLNLPDIKSVSKYEFPKLFYASSVMSGISSAIFLSLDIVLVKHYLDPTSAGAYALLSLVGKMIYFFGSLPAVFMITFVSRAEGLGKKSLTTFYRILGATLFMVVIGFVSLGWYGDRILPILFGSKVNVILEFVRLYSLAISLFTISSIIISYHLAKKQYIFPIASLVTSTLMAFGIISSHESIGDVVNVIVTVSIFGISLMSLMHIFESKVKFVAANALDFLTAFTPSPRIPRPAGGKRILVFNWRDTKHAFAGGAEVYVHEIAKRLVATGNYVTLFCGNDGKSPRNEIVDGVNVIRRGGFYFVYLWAFIYYFTQFRGRYDIVIDGHNGIPFFTPMYVKEPIICVFYHLHQEVFRRSMIKPLAEFACFLERDLMPLAYRNVHFVTISPSSRNEMIEFGLIGKGIEIVYSGVDLESFKPAQKSLKPAILYLGRLKAYKSIGVLITAFKLIAEKVPEASLIIAGSGEEENHLKRLAYQLGVEHKITFTGKISEEEKIKLLQKAWVMVNPSFMEGWGITTIEANACGTPVIGADVPGLRDSIKNFETGYLVSHGDSNGFAEKIIEVLKDLNLRTKMSKKSVAWANNFSWSKASNNFATIINTNGY